MSTQGGAILLSLFRLAPLVLLVLPLNACAMAEPSPAGMRQLATTKIALTATQTRAPETKPTVSAPTRDPGAAPGSTSVPPTPAPAVPTETPTRAPTSSPPRTDIPNTVPTAAAPNPNLALFPDQLQLHGPPFPAAIQNFENGFMIWRSDLNCVYAIRDLGSNDLRAIAHAQSEKNHPSTPKIFGYCFRVEPLGNLQIRVTPPPGKVLPAGALGKVWNAYEGIRIVMGYATAPELAYSAGYPPARTQPAGSFYVPQMTLPNGKMLACVFEYPQVYCAEQ